MSIAKYCYIFDICGYCINTVIKFNTCVDATKITT